MFFDETGILLHVKAQMIVPMLLEAQHLGAKQAAEILVCLSTLPDDYSKLIEIFLLLYVRFSQLIVFYAKFTKISFSLSDDFFSNKRLWCNRYLIHEQLINLFA